VLGCALGVVLLGGCSESLFGAHRAGQGDDAGGTDSGVVPTACPSDCIGNAGADFPGGASSPWRYLEDHRTPPSWTAMTGTTTMMGTDPGNRITSCAANPTAVACSALPEALLVSSAGATSKADPAIEFTAPKKQVIQLSLHAFVPGGAADQTIRLYRNSREDVLFTGTAIAGTTLAHAITLDALAGDRFLVAVAPTGNGATDVGLQLFVNDTRATFPSTCQLALPFTSPASPTTTTGDQCRGAVFTHYDYAPTPLPGTMTVTTATFGTGPFQQQVSALDLHPTEMLASFTGKVLDWSHDITVQFWVQLRQPASLGVLARLFTDVDVDAGGGIDISLVMRVTGSLVLDVTACTDPTTNMVKFGDTSIAYPTNGSWQFVRVVRTGSMVYVCLNGQRMTSLTVDPNLPPSFMTFNAPTLGKNLADASESAVFDGLLDDVRAISGALPCD
jgi:concanavalin A-like lectin/glucanase superfamily protein